MNPAIKVMNEYRTLVVKMMEDQDDVESAKTSFRCFPVIPCIHAQMLAQSHAAWPEKRHLHLQLLECTEAVPG
jgi:hypothetical protein